MKLAEVVDKLTDYINNSQNHRVIVGIDGLSCSGKTHISQEINDTIPNSLILHLDDYIVSKSERYGTDYEPRYEFYFLQWDLEHLKTTLFSQLNFHDSIELKKYDKASDNHSTCIVDLTPYSSIIIEGIFLYREEWIDYYVYKIFVDTNEEIRRIRGTDRDGADFNNSQTLNIYQNRYWKAEKYYIDRILQRHHIDLWINNN